MSSGHNSDRLFGSCECIAAVARLSETEGIRGGARNSSVDSMLIYKMVTRVTIFNLRTGKIC